MNDFVLVKVREAFGNAKNLVNPKEINYSPLNKYEHLSLTIPRRLQFGCFLT